MNLEVGSLVWDTFKAPNWKVWEVLGEPSISTKYIA